MPKITIYPDLSVKIGEEEGYAVLDIEMDKKYIVLIENYEPCINSSSSEMTKYKFSNGSKSGKHSLEGLYSVFSDFYYLQYFVYTNERIKAEKLNKECVMELSIFQSIKIVDIPYDLFLSLEDEDNISY